MVVGVSVVAGGLVSVVVGVGGAGEAEVVLRPGAGVVADLSAERNAIAAAAATSSTAIAVATIATAGSRYQWVFRSEVGRAAVSVAPPSDFPLA